MDTASCGDGACLADNAGAVDADGGAEVFYENLDALDNWSCVYESQTEETNGYNIKFTTYRNSQVKEF